jgi:hypothetical protein
MLCSKLLKLIAREKVFKSSNFPLDPQTFSRAIYFYKPCFYIVQLLNRQRVDELGIKDFFGKNF